MTTTAFFALSRSFANNAICQGRPRKHVKTSIEAAAQSVLKATRSKNGVLQHHRSYHRTFYRQFQNDSKSNEAPKSSSAFWSRLSELRHNGTPEMVIGITVLAVLGVDYAIQVRNGEQKEEMYRQLQREVKRDGEIAREDMMKAGTDSTKSLFQCTVRRIPPNFDGHKCLTDVRIGDVVDVMEEGIGPGGQYNLCSIRRETQQNKRDDNSGSKNRVSVGWLPCSCLEKVA